MSKTKTMTNNSGTLVVDTGGSLQGVTTQSIPLNVYKKLGAIIKEGVTVGKSGYNSFQNYKYATEADIVEAARTKFSNHGLVLTTSVVGTEKVRDDLVRTTMDFTLVDLDSGESLTTTYVGDGQDKGDKGIYKSYTGALKFFLSKTLMIATDSDPEKTDSQPKTAASSAPSNGAGKPKSSAFKAPVKEEAAASTNGSVTPEFDPWN